MMPDPSTGRVAPQRFQRATPEERRRLERLRAIQLAHLATLHRQMKARTR